MVREMVELQFWNPGKATYGLTALTHFQMHNNDMVKWSLLPRLQEMNTESLFVVMHSFICGRRGSGMQNWSISCSSSREPVQLFRWLRPDFCRLRKFTPGVHACAFHHKVICKWNYNRNEKTSGLGRRKDNRCGLVARQFSFLNSILISVSLCSIVHIALVRTYIKLLGTYL